MKQHFCELLFGMSRPEPVNTMTRQRPLSKESDNAGQITSKLLHQLSLRLSVRCPGHRTRSARSRRIHRERICLGL